MSYITYKQADSRWGSKNYNGSSTMAAAGCGPTSVAMLAYAVDGKTTPIDTMKYMQSHGYAIRNNGTAWAGIPACMKAFGLQDVKEINVSSSMTKVWDYMKKGYCGVFLFRAGSRGGITWTTSGHYVAVTDYKVKDSKHYLYTRDSGGRNHTGFYAYETNMKGLIPKVWVGKVSDPKPFVKPTTKYAGTVPNPTLKKGSKGTAVKQLQKFLNWYGVDCGAADGVFGTATVDALYAFQGYERISQDGIYGKDSYKKVKAYCPPSLNGYEGKFPDLVEHSGQVIAYKGKELAWKYGTKSEISKYPSGKPTDAYKKALDDVYPNRSSWGKPPRAGASCDVFVGTIMRACGYDKNFHRGLDEQLSKDFTKKDLYKKVTVTTDTAKSGDIITMAYTKGTGHICVVCFGKTAEASYNQFYGKMTNSLSGRLSMKGKKWVTVYRAAKGTPLKKGHNGTEVTKWQEFLKWYGYTLEVDGGFGEITDKLTKMFQEENNITADGIVGTGTIEVAKNVRR